MAAMHAMVTSDIDLKSGLSIKQVLPRESVETQYKLITTTQKRNQKRMSGLRKAIRAIFGPKDKVNKILSNKHLGSTAQRIKPSCKVTGDNDRTQSRVADSVQAEQSSETPSKSCTSSPSSSETSDTLPSSMTSDESSSSPVKKSSSSLDDRSPPTPPKAASSTKMPRCADRSGFYTYCGHPSYFGTRLYQPSDLVPEEGIFGEWLELGCGETSSTRLVKVMPDGKLAAAKIVHNNHPEDQFRNELDAHHLVTGHPSFPEIVGVVHKSSFRCILQEFVGNEFIPENITLEDALSNNKVKLSDIPEKDWLQIGQDISQGLQHLHNQWYIHQHLSPDNILLYPTDGNWRGWRAKICDLGNYTFAKLTPEGIKGQAQLAMAADVYSLGRMFRLVGKAANVHFLKSIGKKCSRKDPKNRPQMNKICKMLSKVSH